MELGPAPLGGPLPAPGRAVLAAASNDHGHALLWAAPGDDGGQALWAAVVECGLAR